MALNGAAVSILHPPLPVVTPTPTHTAGQCLSRISWLRATPTRVQALHSSICEGAGSFSVVWNTTAGVVACPCGLRRSAAHT